jgi:hypothetical protein
MHQHWVLLCRFRVIDWCRLVSRWALEMCTPAYSGVVGDGVTDDWKALQAAVDNFDTVFLPKGFYRLSRPLVLTRKGVSLVGVGKTISFLMPLSDPVRLWQSIWRFAL